MFAFGKQLLSDGHRPKKNPNKNQQEITSNPIPSVFAIFHSRLVQIRISESDRHQFLETLLPNFVTIIVGISDMPNPATSGNLVRFSSGMFFFSSVFALANRRIMDSIHSTLPSTKEIKTRSVMEKFRKTGSV